MIMLSTPSTKISDALILGAQAYLESTSFFITFYNWKIMGSAGVC